MEAYYGVDMVFRVMVVMFVVVSTIFLFTEPSRRGVGIIPMIGISTLILAYYTSRILITLNTIVSRLPASPTP